MPRKKRDKFLSVEQVAELTALAVRTVQAGKCGTDELLRVTLGTKTVFVEADVTVWIEKRIEAARADRAKRRRDAEPSNVIPMRPRLSNQQIHETVDQIRKAK